MYGAFHYTPNECAFESKPSPHPHCEPYSDPVPRSSPGSSMIQVQIALVWNAGSMEDVPAAARLEECAHEVWRRGGADALVHSVWANFQPAQTNTILGETMKNNLHYACIIPSCFVRWLTRAFRTRVCLCTFVITLSLLVCVDLGEPPLEAKG